METGNKQRKTPTFLEALATLAVKDGEYTVYDMLDVAGFTETVLDAFTEDAEAAKVLLLGMRKLHEIVIPQKELNSYSPEEAAEALETFVMEKEYAEAFRK